METKRIRGDEVVSLTCKVTCLDDAFFGGLSHFIRHFIRQTEQKEREKERKTFSYDHLPNYLFPPLPPTSLLNVRFVVYILPSTFSISRFFSQRHRLKSIIIPGILRVIPMFQLSYYLSVSLSLATSHFSLAIDRFVPPLLLLCRTLALIRRLTFFLFRAILSSSVLGIIYLSFSDVVGVFMFLNL